MEKVTLKHALLNAVQYNGKADAKSVLGKVLAERPEFQRDVETVLEKIEETVRYVNSLSIEEQRKLLGEMGVKIEAEKKPKKEIELPPLSSAVAGKVVFRLAPFPSGPLHIGNARMVVLNSEYAKKYNGKLLLVYDDTIGSEEKMLDPEGYKLIKEGIDWLGIKVDETFYKSDRMSFFYEYAEMLIKKGKAYVCLCPAEELRENRRMGKACDHRSQSESDNLGKWKAMLKGEYKAGQATLRLKTDMKHSNPAFRDRVLLRISGRKHPRVGTKYKVWPMLEYSWAVDDYLLGVTHIIRGKDLVMEDMMEDYIWKQLGWKGPHFIHYGLLRLKEAKLSKSKARIAIKEKRLTGWDDPRTWSLQSLRKRGIQPEAVRKFIIKMGLSQADVSVPAEILYAENRKIIDSVANRYHAVLNPVKISIVGGPKTKTSEIPLHPDFKKRGVRKVPVDLGEVYIEKEDLNHHSRKEIGLMGLFSVKLGHKAKFLSKGIKFESPKIQWVSKQHAQIKIVMPDGSVKSGLCEPAIKKAKVGDLVQLVRIGFCRVDKTDKDIILYSAHK